MYPLYESSHSVPTSVDAVESMDGTNSNPHGYQVFTTSSLQSVAMDDNTSTNGTSFNTSLSSPSQQMSSYVSPHGLNNCDSPFYPLASPPVSSAHQSQSRLTFVPVITSTVGSPHFIAPAAFTSSPSTFQFLAPSSYGSPQMTAPIALTTNGASSSQWKHTVPSTMPWSVPGTSSVKFTAGTIHIQTLNSIESRTSKRKMGNSVDDDFSGKVFVNEEGMAARMRGLSLNKKNSDAEESGESAANHRPYRVLPDLLEHMEDSEDSNRDHRRRHIPQLEISEMLKIGMKTKEILPKAIVEKVTRPPPNMQVVLWQPPGSFVPDLVRQSHPSSSSQLPSNHHESNGLRRARNVAVVTPQVWSVPADEDPNDVDDPLLNIDNNNDMITLNNNDLTATDFNTDDDMDL